MIDFIKIQDEINILLVDNYPDFTVYINKIPQNFERPSFLIEFIRSTPEEVSKGVIKEIDYFTITYFAEVDDYYNTDKFDLQNVLLNIQKIFRKGYIEIEDRAIKVKTSNGGSNDDEIYLDLQFEYYEDREEGQEQEEEIKEIIVSGGIN